jgi:hypothetical protein
MIAEFSVSIFYNLVFWLFRMISILNWLSLYWMKLIKINLTKRSNWNFTNLLPNRYLFLVNYFIFIKFRFLSIRAASSIYSRIGNTLMMRWRMSSIRLSILIFQISSALFSMKSRILRRWRMLSSANIKMGKIHYITKKKVAGVTDLRT